VHTVNPRSTLAGAAPPVTSPPPSTSNRMYVGAPAPEIQEPTGPPRPPPGHPSRTEPPPTSSDDLEGPTTSNRIYVGPPAEADSLDDDALANPPPPPARRGPKTPAPGSRTSVGPAPGPRTAGPPPPADLETAITNPPPFRRRPSDGPITSLPGLIAEAAHQVTSDLEERITGERSAIKPVEDNARTEPSMPRFELPLRAPPSLAPQNQQQKKHWAAGLADRIDKALGDEWSTETPVVPPSPAELRSLLGAPDPTRKQSLDELEALHRAATETPSEPDILNPRRPKGSTAEVDPDDIEAAIEIAPPARKPTGNAIAVAKPKKPE